MSRAFDEKILWYFYKRASSSVLFLLTMASAFMSVGYFKEDGRIFILLGAFLMGITLWQIFRVWFCNISGSEVDLSSQRFVENTNIEQNYRISFAFDIEDILGQEKIILSGYCCYGIETEPLYRWDEEDGKVRSSNYQITYFGMDKGVVFTYSEIKSLVDSEYIEKSYMFNISTIVDVEIRKEKRSCSVSARKNSNTVLKEFETLVFYKNNGETYTFAFDENQIEQAEYICKFINNQRENTDNLEDKVLIKQVKINKNIDFTKLGKKQKKTLAIGIIGDEMTPIC